jgi:Na+/proline symporter
VSFFFKKKNIMQDFYFSDVKFVVIICIFLNISGPCFLIIGLMGNSMNKDISTLFVSIGVISSVFYVIYVIICILKQILKNNNENTEIEKIQDANYEEIIHYTDDQVTQNV